jgi:hypothetical protein
MLDPVSLYKNGDMRKIPAIDASAWILFGWKLEPESEIKPGSEIGEISPIPPIETEESIKPKRKKDADDTTGNSLQ